jgi:hypothetical protein
MQMADLEISMTNLTKYHFDGEVLMRLSKEEEPVKFNIQTDIEAPSSDKVYSYLEDLIRYDSYLNFDGTITEAKDYSMEELGQRIERLEKLTENLVKCISKEDADG